MNRRLLAVAGLVFLMLTSGCLGFFGASDVPDEQLNEPPAEPYDWDTDRDAYIVVHENTTFQAVYRTNETRMELFRRDGFGGTNSIPVSALRVRYPNGTVVQGAELRDRGGNVTSSRDEVVIERPDDIPNGTVWQVGVTSESSPKRFALPTFVKGSYEVVLPPDRRVDFPVFGTVRPPGSETSIDDQSRTHIVWSGDNEVSADSISVQFYLQRDLYIFAGIALLLTLVGGGGVLYYRRQIQQLRERREELGLDVETEDDDLDQGPPPGMR
jgi:hypothetical protein